ncbi:hypothetical protein ElyMa_006228700 [Elysia marginata]|uniref:SXP/RAL-2 family protein Ani s 5-like cation-binding domain-containing protein n=1 Tax=Elysia marginata TaxID=1093978 RepID=A0AAV4H9X9_9GAST|nr:hypothetical protein ElyMa_006228700 [Elysia marginata]
MKLTVFVAFVAAITVVNGASIEKRQFRDLFRNITAFGRDTFSDLLDLASKTWDDLVQKIDDYDIESRFADIKDKVRERYGDHIDRITNVKFDDIAKAAKDIIKDARDVLNLDDIAAKIRKALGSKVDLSDVSDDDITQIAQGVEDDVEAVGTDNGDAVGKRGLRDDLRAAYRNVTAFGRDTFSDLFDLASRGWKNLKQKIQDYDIKGRYATIKQKVKVRYGDFIDRISELKFEHIVKATKDIVKDAADVLRVDRIVGKVRSLLGKDVDNIPDDEIADIVKTVEDDASSDPILDVAVTGGF